MCVAFQNYGEDLYLIQRDAFGSPRRMVELLKLFRRHACDRTELGTEVGWRTEAILVGDFADALISIAKLLLYSLDSYPFHVLFDRHALHFCKQFADGTVFFLNILLQKIREFDGFALIYPIDNQGTSPLYDLSLRIAQQFEANLLECVGQEGPCS